MKENQECTNGDYCGRSVWTDRSIKPHISHFEKKEPLNINLVEKLVDLKN